MGSLGSTREVSSVRKVAWPHERQKFGHPRRQVSPQPVPDQPEQEPVPRHPEVNEMTAKKTLRRAKESKR